MYVYLEWRAGQAAVLTRAGNVESILCAESVLGTGMDANFCTTLAHSHHADYHACRFGGEDSRGVHGG